MVKSRLTFSAQNTRRLSAGEGLPMKKSLRYGPVTATHVVYLVLIALVILWILMRAH